ncbi:MAG: Gldg family protein [Chloroflexota bacterium]
MKRQVLAITRKELNSYFGSPLAIIFLGTFLAAVLFIFFTVETFFARGVADIRPLFRWMPILLIFLLAALTMRQWSEEQRSGTQELLLTLPVSPLNLVLGKFLAVMGLISLALALTLPLPITVGLLGNLDWGPVLGGYLAALLMAAAYAAIGLFVSSRTDNQIVALIATVLLGGLFYVVGTSSVTDFVGGGTLSELLWSLGTGSRFESIQRGVIDLRDLVYYLSLTGVFLALNTVSLDSVRWSRKQEQYRRRVLLTTGLVVINLLLLNVWLYPLHGLRLDLTAQKEYSLSQTTKDLFANLQEPLLIRAYISEKTHPLIAPLIPQVRDMLREYEIASNGRITAEVVDPISDPEIEVEANQNYGIQPMALQTSGRYEASVINAYFDILIRYGDQTVILNFQDLAQFDLLPDGSTEVTLKNLEYDLTSGIKKVVYGFQSIDSVLAALPEPVQLTFFVTQNTLPDWMLATETTIETVANDIAASSGGKFTFQLIDLDDPNSPVTRETLQETYGLQPFPVDLFGTSTYYAHMILQSGDSGQVLYPSAEQTEADVRTTIESALKRTSSGFLKVVGLWAPPTDVLSDPMLGDVLQPLASYESIVAQLQQEYTVRSVDLSTGQAPTDVDVLVVVEPVSMTEKELFAIDQFLMRGGSVMVAASNYRLVYDQYQGILTMLPITDGLGDLLAHYGINVPAELVMDEQNSVFPVAVMRNVGGYQVQEIQAANYPFFVDVRTDGMMEDSPVVSNLPAVTISYASPVYLDEEANAGRETAVLLRSSSNSWTTTGENVQPDYERYPDMGFVAGTEKQSYPLAVTVQGSFTSYFKDRTNPFLTDISADGSTVTQLPSVIDFSPESARLIVIGSSSFADDFTLNLSARLSGDMYLNNLQFFQNSVDWASEDLDLLAIRARGSATHVLQPLEEQQQSFWEIANYVVALVALIAIYFAWRTRSRSEQPMALLPMEELGGER